MKLFFLWLVMLTIVACGEKVQRKNQSPQFWTPSTFDGKSTREVLNLKYSSAVLRCELWSDQTQKIETANPPTDTAAWDLLQNSNTGSTIHLKASMKNHEAQVEIRLVDFKVARVVELTNKDTGATYLSPYSPVLTLEAHLLSASASGKLTGQVTLTAVRSLLENSTEMILFGVHDPVHSAKSIPFQDYVACTLQTVVKPELKDRLSTATPEFSAQSK